MPNDLFLTILNFFAQNLGGNYGLAIIAITLIIRIALLPLIVPSVKSQKKLFDLQPEIDKLKKKHPQDKQALSKAQLELYKKHNVNPLSGCLPQLIQLGLFIVFYQVLINSLSGNAVPHESLSFLWFQLDQPDTTLTLPILVGVSQFLLSLMLLPKSPSNDNQSPKSTQEDFMKSMRTQMVFIMPLFTAFISTRFPSGLSLYWVASTLFSIFQQYKFSGPGGLQPYLNKLSPRLSK